MSNYPLFLKNAFIFAVIVAFISRGHVKAQTAIYIPGADPQPISADILGVGNDGRTTYLIQQGTPTDNEPNEGSFPKATLVEGPSDAFLTFSTEAPDDAGAGTETIVGSVSCTISGSQAVCTSSIQMALGSLTSSLSDVNTEDASPIPVQLGSTVNAPAAATTTGSSTAAPATNSAASSASTGAGSTNTGSSSNKNSAVVVHRATDSMIALGILVTLVSSLL